MSTLVNAYCTHRNPPALNFPHTLNARRDRSDPDLPSHLNGFIGYALSRSSQRMTAVQYHVMRHIQRVQHHLSLLVADQDMAAFGEWAQAANAICFLADGTIRDPFGKMLIDADRGAHEDGADVPYPTDAVARKKRCTQQLAALDIGATQSLPPVIGEEEVELRSPDDVARRMLGLFLAALRAETLIAGKPISPAELQKRLPAAFEALSPKEAAFMADASPDQQQIVNFGWGYEALLVLQWALGLVPALPHPTQICDVPALARVMLETGAEQLVASATLRPVGEILDALDLHFRMHWVARQADLDDEPAPGGIDAGVVRERHRALNWLVQFEYAEWDAVDIPT